MDTSTLIIVLALMTLLAGVAVALWQRRNARRAQKRHEHSAMSEHPKPPADEQLRR